MPARYAVYYAPSAGDALHQAVTPLLGRDALGGLNVPQATPPGVDPVFWKAVTRVSAHYGLHATLKAPFELRHSGMDSQLLRSTGASFLEEVVYGVIPQVFPLWISYSLYRFESNVRSATVVGMVGAGGIGMVLWELIRSFAFEQTCAVMALIVLVVVVFDMLSQQLRKRVL